MTKSIGRWAAILVLAAAVPLSAGAQEPPKKKEEPAKTAPAKRAAPTVKPAAPAARPAQPAPAARVAPAPRPAPAAHVAPAARPAPAARIAPQRQAPQRAAVPQQKAPTVAAPAAASRATTRATTRAQPAAVAKQPAAAAAVKQPAAAAAAVKQPSAVQTRQQLRAERTLQQRENRALRAVPAKQRAAKQQEIQNARQLRAQQRLQQAQPNAVAAPNAALQAQRGTRLNGQALVTKQAAQKGRFAAPFTAARIATTGTATASSSTASVRGARVAARSAWTRGQRAGFVPWYGPVFWPYAYSDVFDYSFWPGGYEDGYFAYAYDDFFDGVFWGDAGPPVDYVYGESSAPPPAAASPSYAAVQQLCTQPGSGVTAWPFADIEKKVGLNDEQKQLLGDVKTASQKAAAVFKASCPSENAFPMTPPGRLGAMTARLDATLEVVQTVRPALEKFYASLSDEQMERFNQIGPKQPADSTTASQASAQESQTCKEQKPGLTNLPIEKVEDAVKPTDAQMGELNRLEEATGNAVSIMQAACPEDTPITPPGRLEAMEKRLQAMIDAAKTVKPALDSFYGSLSAEQKARFNRIGRDLAQNQ
jgi:hypothetical protein